MASSSRVVGVNVHSDATSLRGTPRASKKSKYGASCSRIASS